MPASSTSSDSTLARLRAGQLVGATRLDLSAGLTEFPREIFHLADSLEILNLSDNQLSQLPDDLCRLHKLRILFCSNNRFTDLPGALGKCASLSMVGFKSNQIRDVSPEAFPHSLRWLILTDNQIHELPDTLGNCRLLQKLMLAGNRLRALPSTLEQCSNLELLRLAANQFHELPDWLFRLPRLAWLAASGNPVSTFLPPSETTHPFIPWQELEPAGTLGEGASGTILRAFWKNQSVAVKIFKGAITSDGLPEQELATSLAAGFHPQLIPILGTLDGHPENRTGFVMPILPDDCSILAKPPSLESCTRDIYSGELRFSVTEALGMATKVANVSAHLHSRGILHGDLYAHNLAWNKDGRCFLGDFGAATCYPTKDPQFAAAFQRLDVLAFGHLLGELLERVDGDVPPPLSSLHQRCITPESNQRPLFQEICAALSGEF